MPSEAGSGWARPSHVLLLAVISLYPAIWNGYPLLFSDSGAYLGTHRTIGAPPFYWLFIKITSLGSQLFLTIAVQALISATVVLMALRIAGGIEQLRYLLLLALAVLLLNQMPFLVSWIMPDFLTGLGIAAICLLMLIPERLGLWQMLFMAGVACLAIVTTVANAPLFLGLVIVCIAARWLVMRKAPAWKATLLTSVMLVASCLAIIAANKVIHKRAVLSPASAALTFSRLADTDIAQPVVEDVCKSEGYAVCGYLDSLANPVRGRQDFLWYGVADVTDAFSATRDEYAELNAEVLRRRWRDVLREGLLDTGRLFLKPTLGHPETFELTSYLERGSVAIWLSVKLPGDGPRFSAARQQTGELIAIFPTRFFAASTAISYTALLLLIVLAWRRDDRTAAALGLALVAAIFGQLLLHAMLVGPYPRYHVKVGWLGWLFCAIIWARLYLSGSACPPEQQRLNSNAPVPE